MGGDLFLMRSPPEDFRLDDISRDQQVLHH